MFAAAVAANATGALFVFGCLQWFKHQPYNVPEHVFSDSFSVSHAAGQLGHIALDAPFLLLPIVALFLPGLRKNRPWVLAVGAVLCCGISLPGDVSEPSAWQLSAGSNGWRLGGHSWGV